MRHVLSLLVCVLLAGLSLSCGSPRLDGLALGKIQLEGEYAEELQADLEQALLDAGAVLNQSDKSTLLGTVTWEWAGDESNPYPTLVRIFLHSESEEDDFTLSRRYEVEQGAQPQDVAHYRRQIVSRVLAGFAAQMQDAS